ncbi:MAG TPA: hypothetical protein VNJ47_04285 [Nevskiales bacterium]|nr:hypothetical protein [Nevskiales bacterium]
MNRFKKVFAGSAGLLVATLAGPAALASHEADERFVSSTYADVISSRPVYREVEITTPREECWQEPVTRREDNKHWGVTAQTVTGGVIGGVIANQAVNGSKRDAATALGALIGASIGANRAAKQQAEAKEYVTYERRCRTVQEHRTEQRIEGYDVSYRYGGQTYHTRLPYDPGKRLRVQVSVTPEGV